MSIRKPAAKSRAVVTRAEAPPPLEASFAEVVGLIEQARQRTGWLRTWRAWCLGSAASRAATCSACGSSSRPTAAWK